ncbi:MAG TPA: nuclease [Acidobacteriaceae bacterium]|jgi:hypothetical protein
MQKKAVSIALVWLLIHSQLGFAWSNRGHRLVNQAAAESLPGDVPAFLRSPQGIGEISYLGPEPDRWRPETAPDLSKSSSPDHVFRYEAALAASPLPRQRYEYLKRLETLRQQHPDQAAQLTPQFTGTLPWQVEEVYQRLLSAFVVYRIVTGDVPPARGADMIPLTKDDLPSIEASALFYAGWLGHYVGDGCMPLHASINVSGWIEKSNPNGYTTQGSIHHNYEVVTDKAIEDGKVTAKAIESRMHAAGTVSDSFADTLSYLRTEGRFASDVYRFEKQGALTGGGTPALDTFTEARMAEGASMLRDLIYSAWIQSKLPKAPDLPMTVPLEVR